MSEKIGVLIDMSWILSNTLLSKNIVKKLLLVLILFNVMGCEGLERQSSFDSSTYCDYLSSYEFRSTDDKNEYTGPNRYTCDSSFNGGDYTLEYYVAGLKNEVDKLQLEGDHSYGAGKVNYKNKYIEIAKALYEKEFPNSDFSKYAKKMKTTKGFEYETERAILKYYHFEPNNGLGMPTDTFVICLKKSYWEQYGDNAC